MDATRADLEFTAEVCAIAVQEGATVINIPDTVGYTTPQEYADYFARLYELVPALREVRTSVHCHDDLGLAVANSYAGVIAGARQVECAVNGIGERAGNCSLEEIVMFCGPATTYMASDTGIQTREIARTSRMVSRLTGYPVQPQAVVGRKPSRTSPGFTGRRAQGAHHLRDHGRDRGRLDSHSIVLRQALRSPRAARRARATRFRVEGNALNQAFTRFKEIADKKQAVTP